MFPKVYTKKTRKAPHWRLSIQLWYDGHVSESLHNEHKSASTWHARWHVMASRVESVEEREEKLRRRREHYRIRRERETNEEREARLVKRK